MNYEITGRYLLSKVSLEEAWKAKEYKPRHSFETPDESDLDGASCEPYVAYSCEVKEDIQKVLNKPTSLLEKLQIFYKKYLKQLLCFHNFNYRITYDFTIKYKVCSKCDKHKF